MARRASAQNTVVSTKQLRAAGLASSSVADRVRTGRLFPMFRGSFCAGHEPQGIEPWIQAGALVADGVAAFRGAAHLWDFRPLRDLEPIEVLTEKAMHNRPARPASRGRIAQPELRIHRTGELKPSDWMWRDGIKVTTPERTILDCCTVLPYSQARRMVGQALVLKRVSIRSLLAQLDCSPGHHGAKVLRNIIATARPTRSEAEDRLAELLSQHQLLDWFETNHHVDGVGEFDFYSPALGFAIEFDGREFHDNPIARADDYAKQKRAEAVGIDVMRVRWRDVTIAHARTASRVAARIEGVVAVSADYPA